MAKIAFLILCHRDPEGVAAQAACLAAAGDCVTIHLDAGAGRDAERRLRAALAGNPAVALAPRVRCGWGDWSLVAATLSAIRTALHAFPDATHLYLMSGDCWPIKPAHHVHARLDAEDRDWIESVDFHTSGWIRTGLVRERLIYRHPFNERHQKRLFYASLDLQQRLGLARALPRDLTVMIGSQWWCLRRTTVEAILTFLTRRRDVVRFFRLTWIPDEIFFQTLVRHLIPATGIVSRPPTFLMFTDYGMPVNFHTDQADFLLGQDAFLARKISPEAPGLRARLGAVWTDDGPPAPDAGDGRRLFAFLTGRGRIGARFAPRIWDSGGQIGLGRRLVVIVCKKWHVGKRLAAHLRHDGWPGVDYVFDDAASLLPDLGGIEGSLDRRSRHAPALLRLVFDRLGTDRLVICLDPSRIDIVRDLAADPGDVRFLDLRCRFTDDDLAGHARRIGLIGPDAPASTLAALLPTLKHQIANEADRLTAAALRGYGQVQQGGPAADAAQALARTGDLPYDRAAAIADDPELFAD
ncbi:MAG: beta-1,6-N-acetylglucosaminyltransferase [Rhodobacteraceae bacterium]|jgi:hypothetical protein|nr:beta-1,6-N-acetylglucosaminyltransferase [Paracoccaceae bacterium]